MKTIKNRNRKLMRVRNRDRVNRLRNQQKVFGPLFILVMIRLGFEDQNTPEKLLARLRLHIEKLTGNTNFPVTDPTLAALEDMEEDLEEAIDLVNAGNQSKITDRNDLVAATFEMLRQLSYNIQFLSKGDKAKIESAGFDVRKTAVARPAPGQVLNLVAAPVGPGKIKLSWDREDNSLFMSSKPMQIPVCRVRHGS